MCVCLTEREFDAYVSQDMRNSVSVVSSLNAPFRKGHFQPVRFLIVLGSKLLVMEGILLLHNNHSSIESFHLEVSLVAMYSSPVVLGSSHHYCLGGWS